MRKRGVYFSLLTLAFTQMFFYIVYRATAVTAVRTHRRDRAFGPARSRPDTVADVLLSGGGDRRRGHRPDLATGALALRPGAPGHPGERAAANCVGYDRSGTR